MFDKITSSRALSIVFAATMLALFVSVAAWADDVADCGDTTIVADRSAAACRRLAEQGKAWAQYNLGLAYDRGEGVPQDYKEAAKWYRKAAEQDYADAQYRLGWMYDTGLGVPQNDSEALKWYRLAAKMHNPNGWYNLGKRYENGRGVSKDLVQAYACYDIAAMEYSLGADRDNAIKSRDRVAARMTPGQIAKAKKMETEPGAIVGSTQPGPTPPPAAAGEDILAVSRELIEFFNGKYKRLHPPRAIAVSADGFRWGYSYCGEYRCKIVPSARDLAMQACAQAGGRGCRIFAIDDDIKVKYRVVD